MNFVVPIVLAIASGTLLGEAVFLRGMRMLDKWRRRNPDMPLAESIEKIPFSETRNYVKRILAHYATYKSIYP
ncbi:MAG: hypothetical protein VCC01_13140 [Candidatus Hydrogenedentota bacterium]